MAQARTGSTQKALEKQAQCSVLTKVLLTSGKHLAVLEQELGLVFSDTANGVVPNGDRFRKLLNPKRSPMRRTKFVDVVRRAYSKGWLTGSDVFELGLEQAISSPYAADVFDDRDAAHTIFKKGVERMSAGLLPLSSAGKQGGTPRRPRDHAEALEGYEAWRREIRKLGCWVANTSDWMEWYESTHHPYRPSGTSIFSARSMDPAPLTPKVDDDCWQSHQIDAEEPLPKYHPLLVKDLILICDGDLPYARHPEPLDRQELVRAEQLREREEREWREFIHAIEQRRGRNQTAD
ncbi:MAG: hypothetical protein LBJ65_16800 [Burkholderia sp.]|jgi:hypothetical protein|uniref:hypothetical protein n=1 Tax=Burkholderia sp. TaxID=36773 RepID=UPI00281A44D1|nr:hypothetical protein [Burkholderia sp.]MDR0243255.1 hypothetical protein [Burkholderia sp.]